MIEKILKAFEFATLEKVKIEHQGVPFISFNLTDIHITTLIMTWITMGIIILLAWLGARRLRRFPGRCQSIVEMIIEAFDKLIAETMGPVGRKYFPLITTIFFFVLLSNWLSIIPPLKNPTADLSTTLGLGVMIFIIAQSSGIARKGIGNYIKGFFEPLLIAPLAIVINVFGELGKTISHSFRLFGNIFGGGLILVVVFAIPHFLQPAVHEIFGEFIGKGIYWGFLWPFCKIFAQIGLNLFFGLFVGTIQAFVFTVLAMAYITLARD